MIDAGSSISLVSENLTTNHRLNTAPQGLQLVSADGEAISLLGQIAHSAKRCKSG